MDDAGIRVRVPATVANLGPGFDCLGVALGTHLVIRVSRCRRVQTIGGDPAIPVGEDLTHRALVRAFEAACHEAPAMCVEVEAAYPRSRGMGSSASAIVAGLVAGRELGGLSLSDADLARLAVEIEGHADNVLPALLGGLVLATGGPDGGWMRFKPTPDVAPMVLVARELSATSEARGVLPESVPRADAVANAGATAGLLAVMTGLAPPEGLLKATADRLHEPYRLPLLAETFALHGKLRAAGVATALSGAGPSLICLVPADGLAGARRLAQGLLPDGWAILTPGWDLDGAQVEGPDLLG